MIPAPLLYLLQMQGALLLLLAVYYGLLRRLTFHQLNRAYLLAALVLAALYPVLDLSRLLPAPAARVAAPLALELPTWPSSGPAAAVAAGPDYGAWLLGLYAVGAGLMLLHFLSQAASLWRLHQASRPAQVDGVAFRAVAEVVSPFSFGRTIYLNPAHHAPAELPVVVLHEQVHVRQLHSLDVLLGHLHRALAWASPAAWLWLRAVQENLEFIADAAVLRESQLPARQYQYSLVRLSTLAAGPALVTPFSFIILKNRITMMNARPSSPRQLLRYAAGLSLLATLAVSCATPKAGETPQPLGQQKATNSFIDEALFFVNGLPSTKEAAFQATDKDPENKVNSVHVFKSNQAEQSADMAALRRDFGDRVDKGVALVITEKGQNDPALRDFVAKYSIKLSKDGEQAGTSTINRDYYRKLVDGQGLTDAEIGGRLIMINKMEATPEQLRALPAGAVAAFALSNDALPKFGERGKKGVIMIKTKDSQ
ncbi:M56 family metallopeptidase [Hymenobacter sp. NST-14]|uniref:M56 family metallopeptidase n=1 Tax=Hymenobacter piscis TaxID=2839984 RepID=UPI001C02CB70|nr:M56 family metallopeptidase [Hymenobacter piscis]MBT9392952.1 M56 family metallopeptidase [Hymenobacter piscis]